MTNFEKIKAMSVEEMAKLLCRGSVCEYCDADKLCDKKGNGFLKWLESEEEE